jgi:divalent metal cation (Fe/Co/Zn/Cd) transporter
MRAEKRKVAGNSLLAALAMTGLKIFVGVTTGSLGILSEAAHSALDLVAATITLFSVRVSDKPADADHQYGHGKIENFSAFIETGLLLVTCVVIIYEAIKRLFFHHVEIEPSAAAFLTLFFSRWELSPPNTTARRCKLMRFIFQLTFGPVESSRSDLVWLCSGAAPILNG